MVFGCLSFLWFYGFVVPCFASYFYVILDCNLVYVFIFDYGCRIWLGLHGISAFRLPNFELLVCLIAKDFMVMACNFGSFYNS